MRFEFDGRSYYITFQRKHREYLRHDYETGLDFNVKSKYPDTTVTIFETDPAHPLDKKVFRTATVGCWREDHFSLEKGRVRALRLATVTCPLAMKPLLWKAYHDRKSQDLPATTPGERDGNSPAQVGSPSEA